MSDTPEKQQSPIDQLRRILEQAVSQDRAQQREEEAIEEKQFTVRILWGMEPDSDNEPTEYSFATEAELDAFLHGVEEGSGWIDYKVIYPNADGAWPERDEKDKE